MLHNGQAPPSTSSEEKPTASIPDRLLRSNAPDGQVAKASGDQAGKEPVFSHEVAVSSSPGKDASTADKIKKREMLLQTYASKELASSQMKSRT